MLVDLENVQPGQLPAVAHDDLHVWLFAGSAPAMISVQLAAAVHASGVRARFIQMSGSGRDALDFHIACYLGEFTVQHPDAHFTIMSRVTGCDPLIRHLREQGIRVKCSPEGCAALKPAAAALLKAGLQQSASVAGGSERAQFVAAFESDAATTPGGAEILHKLLQTTTSRPCSPQALTNLIKSSLQHVTDESSLAQLLRLRDESGLASLNNDRLECATVTASS